MRPFGTSRVRIAELTAMDRELEITRQRRRLHLRREFRQAHRRKRQIAGRRQQVLVDAGPDLPGHQATTQLLRNARVLQNAGLGAEPRLRPVSDRRLPGDEPRCPQHAAVASPLFECPQGTARLLALRREGTQQFQPPAALDDNRHLVGQTKARQLIGEAAKNRTPERHVRVIVVDEEQVVRRHELSFADRRRRLVILRLDGTVLQDLREVLDVDLRTIHEDAEVVGSQTGNAVSRPVLDDDLQVDHPDVDLLAEEQVDGRGRVGPWSRPLSPAGSDQPRLATAVKASSFPCTVPTLHITAAPQPEQRQSAGTPDHAP